MVLVFAALTGTAFGAGVMVGLAVGASSVACVYVCRKACQGGAEERPSSPRPQAREEQPTRPGRTKT
jgi:F0F1-type ATP synthase membrane subunit c/vacuolar-type H+-ATPase subunit K